MNRTILIRAFGITGIALGALALGALLLGTVGPSSSWNVFASEPTSTPTNTATATNTQTYTPSATPTPTITPTPTNTPVPTPTTPPPAPPAVPGPEVQGERWIDIDLGRLTATAMVGETPLYTALMSSGKDGWDTPIGTFYIQYRVQSETMTSAAIGAEEYYVLEDVLYTQYFTNSGHALHLNYWRDDYYFGSVRSSHGCVGLRLADAEFFWRFAGTGTRVVIHGGGSPSI